jgi:hypothetical protein
MMKKIERHIQISGDRGSGCARGKSLGAAKSKSNHQYKSRSRVQDSQWNPEKDVKGNDVAEHKENHSARQTPNTMNPNEKWSSRCQGTRQPVGSRDHKELY